MASDIATATAAAPLGPAASPADARRCGQVIDGKYRLVRWLGAGGMGTVYEAVNTWTRRRVAVKLLRPECATDAESVRRFMLEARTAASLAHPHIVDVLDMGQHHGEPRGDGSDGGDDDARNNGELYIVQELLEGTDLRGWLALAGGTLAPRAALEILVPIMDALVAAHARGVIHRDLKPDNIFLARDRHGMTVPKLIDFGVSKVTLHGGGGDTLLHTRAGVAMGTPRYMSPEQTRGDADLDARTDVWSLGVVLYEALAGRVPLDASNHNLLVYRILAERPPRIEQHAPAVPPALAAVVHRALEPDRALRFGSMRAFREAARACLAPGVLPARASQVGFTAVRPGATTAAATSASRAARAANDGALLTVARGDGDDGAPTAPTRPARVDAPTVPRVPVAATVAREEPAIDTHAAVSRAVIAAAHPRAPTRRARRALAACTALALLAGAAVARRAHAPHPSAPSSTRAPRGDDPPAPRVVGAPRSAGALGGPTAAAPTSLAAALPAPATTETPARGPAPRAGRRATPPPSHPTARAGAAGALHDDLAPAGPRLARARACYLRGQLACVLAVLGPRAERGTEPELGLLAETYWQTRDRPRALAVTDLYTRRFPHGPRAALFNERLRDSLYLGD